MTVELSPSARIVKLDEVVVNRIAAGEIIQRPANALKELVENAIDAGATAIDVIVDGGGLKSLQITDNGSGILLADLPILCERFTTSKLRNFKDLESMRTYGFRGEALASITHVSHLTLTTKTAHELCAYRAHYRDGVLVANTKDGKIDPKPVAGNQGTIINIEDMFYNIPSRKRALSKPGEEYARIVDVVNKYAIHCQGISFSCKRTGDSLSSLSTNAKNTTTDNVRLVYGSTVANELLTFEYQSDSGKFGFRGLVTGANYRAKKFTCLLFINGRLVESSVIKKHIEATHSNILAKGDHPFIYLSIDVEPSRVDVNIHPTKHEVRLLDEELIVTTVASVLVSRLAATDSSRTYLTQTILPGPAIEAGLAPERSRRDMETKIGQTPANFVRTDSKQTKLVSMLDPSFKGSKSTSLESCEVETLSGRERIGIKLASIKELRAEVRGSMHEDLTAIFTEHVFVGIVDLKSRLCVVQHLTKLYLVDYGAVSAELFYQIGLSEFGNFGTIILKPALDIKALLQIAGIEQQKHLQEFTDSVSRPQISSHELEDIFDRLISRREMLEEYFSFKISDTGKLQSLPLLLKHYNPSISKLPAFLLRLGQHVQWQSEKKCFESFLHELALYYVPEVFQQQPRPVQTTSHIGSTVDPGGERDKLHTDKENALRASIEDVLFPAYKRRLLATKKLAEEKRVIQIGELNQLYKTFERC